MEKLRNWTVIAAALSLLFHLVVGVGLHFSPTELANKNKAIELIYLDAESTIGGQIVDQSEKQINDEVPEDSKFLSRHNQRVVQETRAAKSGRFQNDAGDGLAPKAAAKSAPEKNTTSKIVSAPKGLPSLADLKPKFNWDKVEESKQQHQGVRNPGHESQSSDYLKELEVGKQTVLSTKEFVYFTYYARIKDKIQLYWEPSIKEKVYKLFKQGRKIASVDRKTRLLIILDNNGKLVAVKVLGQSGIHDLDEAAIDAFQDAAPFPNPPSGLLDPDGTVKIRWDFILEA